MSRQLHLLLIYIAAGCSFEKCHSQEVCGDSLCIRITNQSMTWIQAENYCHSNGWSLASYRNIQGNLFNDMNIEELWIRNGNDSLLQQWRWLERGPIEWPLKDAISNNTNNYRGCLATQHTQAGQTFISSNCEKKFNFICKTEHGRECRLTKSGVDYKGSISKTDREIECALWKNQSSILVPDTFNFTDGNKDLAENYCRNPDSSNNLWCFIPDGNQRTYDSCDHIPLCHTSGNSCFSEVFPKQSVYCDGEKCYIAVDGSKTWIEAIECCQSLDARLATFNSMENGESVYDHLREYISNHEAFWLGGYDRSWDSISADGVQCYLLRKNQEDSILAPCDSVKAFACEYDKPTTTTTTTTTSTTTSTTAPQTTTSRGFIMETSSLLHLQSTLESNTSLLSTSYQSTATDNENALSPGLPLPSTTTPTDSISQNSTAEIGSSEQKSDNKTIIYIAIGAGIGVLLLIVIVVSVACVCCKPRKKKKVPTATLR